MNNIAIITARSGSKGLKDKNIKRLNGIPLLAYSINAANESSVFSEVMVSTDSEHYAKISRDLGASVPFLRSEMTSSDNAGSWDVVKEVLLNYKNKGILFDTVCLLQPTSPLRTAVDIKKGYSQLIENDADSITSVCEVDHNPLWTMVLPDDNSLSEYRKKSKDLPRQQLDKYYRVNGALYIRKIKYIGSDIIICNDNEYAYVMDRRFSIDIDTQEDFDLAEFYMKRNKLVR